MQPTYFLIAVLLMVNMAQCDNIDVCERHLGGIISYLCNNVAGNLEDSPTVLETVDGQRLGPWMAHRFSYAMSSRARSKRLATVVDICCHKPCDINELMSPC